MGFPVARRLRRGEFDERQIVRREFVVSGRDTPTLLDLVEEPFDQVPRAIQIRAEADRVFSILFGRNVRPSSLLAGKLRDPVGVVAAIREQHRLGKHGAEENRTKDCRALHWA